MPIPREMIEPPIEVTSQIDGEGEIDPIIQQQVADDRAGRRRRELPEDFLRRVMYAQEYALRHQHLDEDECCRRRGHVNEWLEHLRWGDRFDEWTDRISRHLMTERELTPEEQAAEDARAEERKAERKIAEGRAEALLRSALDPKQLGELERRGYFHVEADGRRFRITRGRSHNIKEVDGRGRIRRTLCAHPTEQVPDADTMLAQKLMLESRPEEFFKLANVLRHYHPRRRSGVGRPVANTEGVERLVLDRVAEQVARQANGMQAFFNQRGETPEQQAHREWRAAEQDMRILENAAQETVAGVQPAPQAPEPLPEGNVRAA